MRIPVQALQVLRSNYTVASSETLKTMKTSTFLFTFSYNKQANMPQGLAFLSLYRKRIFGEHCGYHVGLAISMHIN